MRSPISVGKFDNRTNYLRGVFSDGVDRLGGQAKTIVVSHLQRSGRFQVMDRDNLSEIKQEAGFNKKANQIKGARYVVTGDVTAFGRKVTGDQQLFGILGRGKEQVAYAKVDLNVVDVTTSEVVYSASGAGEYSLSNREVIGFGGTASYDSTLNGKVLDLAIRERWTAWSTASSKAPGSLPPTKETCHVETTGDASPGCACARRARFGGSRRGGSLECMRAAAQIDVQLAGLSAVCLCVSEGRRVG